MSKAGRWLLAVSALLLLFRCNPAVRPTGFTTLAPGQTGISFENRLSETEDFNIVEYLYFYNGGGVAAGDINNDGLTDVYFSSNQDANKLYLNAGDWRFEDITDKAGAGGRGNWKTGVTMADVNGDGWLDIFSCGVGGYKNLRGSNQLLINNRDLTFSDHSEAVGLSFTGFSTQAAFFDYDNDGDLDMYLLNHSVHSTRSQGDASLRYQSDAQAGDRLYRNDLIPTGTLHFEDVTARSGIYNSAIGYGLGVGLSDLNNDGYTDIYVSNDFRENDYLYINQGDGTFRQTIESSMGHSSRFSMGNDIADINNDGWMEVVTLDMLPWKEEVIKASAGEDPYEVLLYKQSLGFHHQVARNTLQLNRGVASGGLLFSDIAPYAGIEATDWSWGALLADFDLDGYTDVFITNGILRRPNDLDYINYIFNDSVQRTATDAQIYTMMPGGEVPNRIYRNMGDLKFSDFTFTWLSVVSGLSMGAAWADFDNDGDLDIVVNNLNRRASILRNDISNYGNSLKIKLKGPSANTFGLGAKVCLYQGGKSQWRELSAVRGWQSSSEPMLHFGMGTATQADSAIVLWPGGNMTVLFGLAANQTIEVRHEKVAMSGSTHAIGVQRKTLFQRLPNNPFVHKENPTQAFTRERLVPHALDTQGPRLAVGDLNNDRLNDVFVGGASGQPGAVLIQQTSGVLKQTAVAWLQSDLLYEDTEAAIFDANGDGLNDLFVASGEGVSDSLDYLQPRLYINNGKMSFTRLPFPDAPVNATAVAVADYDKDGDKDVFLGGRSVRGAYGLDPMSLLFRNDGRGAFEDLSTLFAGGNSLGMVSDAAWVDIDGDGRLDLAVVGEWMPVSLFLQTEQGNFVNRTLDFGLGHTAGWWNTIEATDIDQDGDMDIVAGNLGTNSRLRASIAQPVRLYVEDIDKNGSSEPIVTYYNGAESYPFLSRDQLLKQVPSLKKKYRRYGEFASVRVDQLIQNVQAARVKEAATFASTVFLNQRNQFTGVPLPAEAQFFPIFSFCANDFDDDGIADLLAVGNLYEVQPDLGRYDAGYGIMLKGNGDGTFTPLPDSGFFVPGQGRDIEQLTPGIFLVARNHASLLMFQKN